MDLNQPVKLPEMNHRNLLAGLTGAVAIAAIYFVIKLSMAMFTAHSVSAAEMQQRQMQLKAQDLQVAPMRGMDQKLADANSQADKFYQDRLPAEYSTIAAELGKLQKDTGVRQTRVTYTPHAASGGVTEIRMEASLMGDYQPLMKFINAMERDKLFFVIRGVTLTGTQGGIVNLRLRMNTYLRPGSGADAALAAAQSNADNSGNAAGNSAGAPAPEQE
jgi:Tfp pilus assembly protein PilO